ncbi:hypothetical protein NPX13_g2034 [Xylaria arbuscula]|uniref:Uncharacterized protein n=1 Tax=Xylaria arbuscula TaxID=114810 RepID=A0A9W8NLH7_9PEZI|nr:hypothetical protein NPX13_g2034 [Xylaria arbuscula]
MGNTPSAEAPRKVSRTPQKLSKPFTGNPATAGLLSQGSVSDIIRQPPSSSGRRLSLPHCPTPVQSSRQSEPEINAVDSLLAPHRVSTLTEDPSSPTTFQPDPQTVVSQRLSSLGALTSSNRGRGMSRRSSGFIDTEEGYDQAVDFAAPPRTMSLISRDFSSYEAQRMLSLAEAPSFEDELMMSESQSGASRRPSFASPYHPSPLDPAMRLPRNSSDTSLYTPMRRRSLMTPGIATRPAPADPIKRWDIQDYSVPPLKSSPSEHPGPVEVGFLSLPPLSFDPSLIPRVETPCETEYKQTGAFRHGTLRITNGSPARTPARETADGGSVRDSSPTAVGRGSYFDTRSSIPDAGIEDSETASSLTSAGNHADVDLGRGNASEFLPELELTSSFSIGEFKLGAPELQITSRQSAIEDELFEEASPHYGAEVLNVRLDHDAKQLPGPSIGLGDENRKAINRSDSGIVASPTSTAPHKTLSKADSGYSSSISTHSSSSRRNGRKGNGHSYYVKEVSPKSPPFQEANSPGGILMSSGLAVVNTHDGKTQPSSPNSPPPKVPEKDVHVRTQNQIPARKPVQFPTKTLNNKTSQWLSPTIPKSNNTTVALSESVGNARQSGRLHRFLSGHTSNQEVELPPVLRVTQGNPHERSQAAPHFSSDSDEIEVAQNSTPATASKTYQHHGLDSESHATQTHHSISQPDQEKLRGSKSSFRIHSISSTISRAASSVIAKNPILRKPLLSRPKLDDVDATAPWHQRGSSEPVIDPPHFTGEADRYGVPATREGRASSLSMSAGRDSRVYDNTRRSSLPSQSERHATAFRQPSGQYPVSKTPPVSLTTRNMGYLRVPPPIRPRSTPVKPVAPTISHKTSREGVQSYPPYNHPMNSIYANPSQRSSQESFYNYSAAQFQGHMNQAPQMSSNLPWGVPSQSIGTATPSHSVAPSRESSFDHSRHNSLASQTSHRSAVSNGQSWRPYPPYNTPTLKHRSSYDSHSLPARQTYSLGNVPYPTPLQMNGQLYAADHVNGQGTNSQPRQYPQQARYGSRGHVRHYSLDQNGRPVQYRVLHSYNSPAYRGVPIWSA